MRTAAIAGVLVALLLLVPAAPEADADGIDTYTVAMRVGDSFSYEPTVNMEDTVIDLQTKTDDAISWDGTTMTARFLAPGQRQAILAATWTSPEDPSLTQTVRQGVDFQIFPNADVWSSSRTARVFAGTTAGTDIGITFGFVEPRAGTVNTVTCELDSEYLEWDALDGVIKTSKDVPAGASETVTATVKVVNSATDKSLNLRDSTAEVSVLIVVGSGLAVSAPGTYETWSGATDASVSLEAATDAESVVWTASSGTDGLLKETSHAGTSWSLGIDPSKLSFEGAKGTAAVDVTATALWSDGSTRSETSRVQIAVWKDESDLLGPVFDTDPEHGFSVVLDGKNASIAVPVEHMRSYTIDWGDGTDADATVGTDMVVGSHGYDRNGRHAIDVTARNGELSSVLRIVCSGGTYDIVLDPTEPFDDGSDKDGSGWIWAAFVVLAIALLVVYVAVYCTIPVLAGAVLSGVVAVLLFIGGI